MQLIEHDNLFGAMEYGFEQLRRMLRRLWWLVLIGAVALTGEELLPLIPRTIVGNIVGLGFELYIAMIACSNLTGERIEFTREVLRFWGATYFVALLWWLPVILPLPKTAFFAFGSLAFYGIAIWIITKLSPAYGFFFLSDARIRNTAVAYRDSWDFASGKTWWKFAAIQLLIWVPVIVLYTLADLFHLNAPNMFSTDAIPLTPVSLAFEFVYVLVAFVAEIWATCAWVAIVSTSPQLTTRNLEASLQTK